MLVALYYTKQLVKLLGVVQGHQHQTEGNEEVDGDHNQRDDAGNRQEKVHGG